MLRIMYEMFKDYGTLGAVIGFGGLNFYWIYKIATNHLKHLSDDIKEVRNENKDIKKEVGNIKERVSKIEGKIE